jgi:hypothetical protein
MSPRARSGLCGLALTAALVGCLGPYVYLARHAHPVADDYSHALKSRQAGYLASVADIYVTWSGRYSSNVLILQNPILWGSRAWYRAVPPVLIVLTVLGFYALFTAVFRASVGTITRVNLALALTLAYLFHMPSVAEGLYWYTGAVTYHAAHVLFLVYASLLVRFFARRPRGGPLALAALGGLVIALVGFNEIVMLMTIAFHLIGVWRSRTSERGVRAAWGVLLAVSVLAALALALAPGNAVRAAHFARSHDLVMSLAFTAMQTIRFFFEWFSSAPLLLGSILLVPLVRTLSSVNSPLSRGLALSPPIAFLLLPAVLVISVFPAYWATGILGQHRSVNTGYFFFLLAWLVNVVSWVGSLDLKGAGLVTSPPARALIVCAAVGSMAFTHNGYSAAYDLVRGTARQFDAEMTRRVDLIHEATRANRGSVVVARLEARPRSLFVVDLARDPDHWINRGAAEFLGGPGLSLATD